MRALRTIVSAQQALVHILASFRRRAEVPAGAAQRRAIVAARSVHAFLVIPASRTDRTLIYIHAITCVSVSLVS